MSAKLLVRETPHGFGLKLLASLISHSAGSFSSSRNILIFVEDARATTRGMQHCS